MSDGAIGHEQQTFQQLPNIWVRLAIENDSADGWHGMRCSMVSTPMKHGMAGMPSIVMGVVVDFFDEDVMIFHEM